MCGIYMTNIQYSSSEISDKLNSIKFRGPDNMEHSRVNEICLGHLRLSILDLDARSNQPYSYEGYHIVYNGEIYNFHEIKQTLKVLGYEFETTSDTEVLIKGYAEWGKEILPMLNGMFSFSIYNSSTNTIFSARDRVGVKPFYYYWHEGLFEISSQMRPLIRKNSKVSEEAVSIYLDCGYIPSPYSILEGVNKLPPGNYMEMDLTNKTITISEYWNLKVIKQRNISYEEAKGELHKLLTDAVKIRMQADVPLGAFLSGGIDSSLIASIASKHSKIPINTFTIGFDNSKYDESAIASQYAKILGTKHKETMCRAEDVLKMLPYLVKVYDEPFADSSALPSLLLNSITKEFVTVALSGDGGDESFLGYVNFDLLNKFEKIKSIPYPIRKMLSKFPWYKILGGKPDTIKSILEAKESDDLSWKIFTGYDSLQKKKTLSLKKYYDGYRTWSNNSFQRLADLNIKLWLENDSNVKVDRASMAFSVEARSPFLDYRIIEFARTLPVKYRYDNGTKKKILRDILSEYIPEDVFNQPKRGFAVPMKDWLRNELKADVLTNLSDSFLKRVPNFDIVKFKKRMELFYSGKYDYSTSIWRLYVLSLWYKEFDL